MTDQNPIKKDFEKFYQENIDKIYRFVFFRANKNKELAEDLVSEIFIKALKNFNDFDEKISRSAWIFTIAKNHLANYWRDQKPMESLSKATEEGENGSEAYWLKQAFLNFRQLQLKQEIYDLLAKLDDGEREIVTFHYLFGYSYSEIAEMKGKTETAIKVAVHRVIKKIRAKI